MRIDRYGNWVVPANWRWSPNQDRRPEGVAISLIVIHGISLPPGRFGTGCPTDLFLNRLDLHTFPSLVELEGMRVSAHVLIDRDGRLTQFVPFGRRAWHAGRSEYRGRPACNDFSVGIELEGADNIPYEPVQYRRLAALCACLMATHPGVASDAIVGHSDIAPGRKTDPGPAFDWSRFRYLLQLARGE